MTPCSRRTLPDPYTYVPLRRCENIAVACASFSDIKSHIRMVATVIGHFATTIYLRPTVSCVVPVLPRLVALNTRSFLVLADAFLSELDLGLALTFVLM